MVKIYWLDRTHPIQLLSSLAVISRINSQLLSTAESTSQTELICSTKKKRERERQKKHMISLLINIYSENGIILFTVCPFNYHMHIGSEISNRSNHTKEIKMNEIISNVFSTPKVLLFGGAHMYCIL